MCRKLRTIGWTAIKEVVEGAGHEEQPVVGAESTWPKDSRVRWGLSDLREPRANGFKNDGILDRAANEGRSNKGGTEKGT